MPSFSFYETAQSSRNAVLATKVAKALRTAAPGSRPSGQAEITLRRGVDLLTNVVEGCLLVEQRTEAKGVSPSQEGLAAFTHALTALQQLKRLGTARGFSDYFLQLREQLVEECEGRPGSPSERESLMEFFRTVSTLFQADVQRAGHKPLSRSSLLLTA